LSKSSSIPAMAKLKAIGRRSCWSLAGLIVALVAAQAFVNAGHQGLPGSRSATRPAARAATALAADAQFAEVQAAAAAAGTAAARREVRLRLLAAAASTCRGQCGSDTDREGALQLVRAMEALNPTAQPTQKGGLLEGTWRLIYASEDVTRSSPFFWGWRKMLKGIPDPSPLSRAAFGTEELSESIFAFTDSIPLKTVGEATQTIYNGQMVNRVAVEVWGLGATMMTTTCRYMPADDPAELMVTIETTQAIDNTLPLADQVVFPSESFLGDNARIRIRITYLDEDLRIFRNELDDQVFVYVRA